jgi:hypothetical protein
MGGEEHSRAGQVVHSCHPAHRREPFPFGAPIGKVFALGHRGQCVSRTQHVQAVASLAPFGRQAFRQVDDTDFGGVVVRLGEVTVHDRAGHRGDVND